MPLALRSALPTVPGVPAWGAVVIAAVVTFIGFVLDAIRGTELTAAFSIFFFLGCVAAVLAVRNRGVFTAMVQPPLLLVVAVPLSYQFLSADSGGGLRDLLLNVAIPLVNRFPLMLVTTLVVVGIGAGRMYIRRQAASVIARPARRSGPGRRAGGRSRTDAAPLEEDSTPAADPAHAPGNFASGRYPTRATRAESAEERTDVYNRPAEPRRADDSPQFRGRSDGYDPGYRYPEPRYTEPRYTEPRYTEARHTGPSYPAGQGTGRHQRGDDGRASEPLHPIPQVRYRDRGESPQDPPPYRYR